MDLDTDLELEEEAPPVHELVTEDVTAQPSLAEQLRARRAEIAQSKTVMLPLTGFEELGVLVEHRLMDRKEVEHIGRGILGETRDRSERNMRILIDMILASTNGFFLKQDGMTHEEEILDDQRGNKAVTTWPEFAFYLGWQTNGMENEITARDAVEWIFAGNEFAIGQYGVLLNRWMGNTGLKVDEEFLGEGL